MAGPVSVRVDFVRLTMFAMSAMPDLPDGERRRMVVHSLAVAEAPSMVDALVMRSRTWRAINHTAIQALAKTHSYLTILAEGALPSRVDSPVPRTLYWIRPCEELIRQCATQVGGTFEEDAISLCDEILYHVRPGGRIITGSWILSNAKAMRRKATKIIKGHYTLSEVDDEDNAVHQHDAKGEEGN